MTHLQCHILQNNGLWIDKEGAGPHCQTSLQPWLWMFYKNWLRTGSALLPFFVMTLCTNQSHSPAGSEVRAGQRDEHYYAYSVGRIPLEVTWTRNFWSVYARRAILIELNKHSFNISQLILRGTCLDTMSSASVTKNGPDPKQGRFCSPAIMQFLRRPA